MCNNCFDGMWCVDEAQQYDKFVNGFTKKKRIVRPAGLYQPPGPIAPVAPAPNAGEQQPAQGSSLSTSTATPTTPQQQ